MPLSLAESIRNVIPITLPVLKATQPTRRAGLRRTKIVHVLDFHGPVDVSYICQRIDFMVAECDHPSRALGANKYESTHL